MSKSSRSISTRDNLSGKSIKDFADVDQRLKEINQWVIDLDSIDINDLHPNVKCEFLMIAEESSTYTKLVKMIQFYSGITTNGKIITISTKDIYDFIINHQDRLRHWDDRFYRISQSACSEAYVYILIQKPIPVDLLVKLLKLKIISVINEIIYTQKMVATLRQQTNYFQAPTREGGETKKKGKKKGNGIKSKGEKSKGKKGKATLTVIDPCVDYQYTQTENISPDENIPIPGCIVYIALIGFYIPNLIAFCYWNGMPLQSVIKFGDTKIKYSRFTSETTLESIHYDEDYLILKPDIKYAPKPELHQKKEQVLLQFWRRVNAIYNIKKPEYVKHSFIMNYNPLFFSVDKKNMKLYLHLSERIYEDFSQFIERLAEYKRQYITYLESMKVYQLDEEPKKVEVSEMNVYNDAMDALPIDVISVSLILDNLIKEVIHRDVKSYITINTSKSASDLSRNMKKQSYYFELEDKMCHRTLRDQLKNIFLHFKMTRCEYTPKLTNDIGNFGASVNDKPYITHENNIIEMTLNYYKFLPECVLNTLVTYLEKNLSVASLSDLPPLTDAVISRNKKELHEWCSLMKVDEKDLILSLSVILIGMFIQSEVVLSSNEMLNLEHFPVQKAVHEIQANIWNKSSRKALPCMEHTNPYEKISPLDFKWMDTLSPIVALQELARASEQFECVERRYIEILDTMLYRFHHNADDYGITTKFWKENIRTPVNLNDFMTYVVYTDIYNIIEQEERHRDEVDLCQNIRDTIDNMSDFTVHSEDFLLPGSLKTSYANEVQTTPEAKEKKGKKEKAKDTKAGSANAKTKSTGQSDKKKIKKADPFDARTIIEDEPLKSDIQDFDCDYTLLKEQDPPKSIPAVNFNGLLLTSSGITTSFYSMDDLKVTIDQVQICDKEAKLSAKVTLNGHNLVVHRETKEIFSFLVNFKSGIVLACASPTTYSTSQENDFYLMSEESDNIISCMRSSFYSKKYFTMSDNIFQRFAKSMLNNITKQTSCSSVESRNVTSSTGPKFMAKEVYISTSNTIPEKKRRATTSGGNKNQETGISIQSLVRKPVDYSTVSILNEESSLTRRGFYSELKLLKKYTNVFSPKFRVCSSKLHKYNFLKRVATPVEMDLNEIIRFMARTKKESKRKLSIKKRYKISRESAGDFRTAYDYDFRITLPSGLHLRNVVGERGTSICQYYFQKGAICSPIFDEHCRLFLGNGTVTVKKDNGKFIIYCANGEIIKYETALLQNAAEEDLFRKDRDFKKDVPKFLKRVRRNLYNLTKDRRQFNYMSSRRMWKKQIKRYFCRQMDDVPFSTIKFTFTTSDGRVLYYDNGNITESSGYYVEREDLIKMGQVILRREDGTMSILTDEGHMQTTFSDGTKITVWCEIDAEPVIIDLRDKFGPDCEDMGPFVKIVTCYQYEHPHYITLLSNGPDEKLMMRVASGEIFDITNRHFLIGIDEWTTLLANKEVIRFVGTPCDDCEKFCECDFFINQLYNPPPDIDNERIFLKVTDTYNKSFIVHYDGSSERNEEYTPNKNSCGHHSHKTQPCQAFFALNRDFSGNALWTSDDYNKRLSEANDADTNYLVFYVDKCREKILSTEWKTFEKQHYNFRFVWPQFKTCKDDVEEFDISTAAFVKQRIVKRVPRNTVRNLIKYIFTENVELFSQSRAEVKRLLSSTKTSVLPSLYELPIINPSSNERVLFERKVKNKNKECNDIVDKIIEYFVKKTGRYYRSKVYENFCGVKLMLDDEEEIFFLANFDTSSQSSSATVSDTFVNTENAKQNLSLSMEFMRSRISKSTSAVQTAVEVIKQLELERQKDNKPKSHESSGKSLEKITDSKSIRSTFGKPDVGVIKEQSSRLISVVGAMGSTKSLNKPDTGTCVTTTERLSSILKATKEVLNKMPSLELITSSSSTSRFISQCDINLQQLVINKTSGEYEQFHEKEVDGRTELPEPLNEQQPKGKSEKTKIKEQYKQKTEKVEIEKQDVEQTEEIQFETQSKEEALKTEISPTILSEYSSAEMRELARHDTDAMCNVIAQTLRRIRQEKFGNLKALDDHTPEASELHLKQKLNKESSVVIMSIKSGSESIPPETTIIRDLFNVPRAEIITNIKRCATNDLSPSNVSATGDCYSDFSLKDLADSKVYSRDAQEIKESMVSLNGTSPKYSAVNQDHSCDAKKRSVVYLPDEQLQREYYLTMEHMQERSLSSGSTSMSVDESQAFLEHTPSMVPLVNIRSLTIEQSLPNIALMSVLSFMSSQGKTPSMKVLRSMSELEKDYEFIIVENTGIVTDTNKTEEVQTDIVYEDFRDDELE